MAGSHVATIAAANATIMVDGNLDAIAEYFAPNYLVHLTGEDMTGGHELIRKVCGTYRRAFSDLKVEVEILVKSKDRVAWQRTIRATHKGSFKGFPATGRPIVWRDMLTTRFADGLIAEEWLLTDLAEQLLKARKR